MLCNLFLCPIEYVVKVFNKIKNNSDNERFDEFIKYYEDYYIIYKIIKDGIFLIILSLQ